MSKEITKFYHYVYKITFETGHIYYGVRSCKCLPENDPYIGSPKTHRDYWVNYEPKKAILKTFDSRQKAEEAERFLINWQWNSTDEGKSLSLNACCNCLGWNNFGKKLTEEELKKAREYRKEMGSEPYKLWSPEGEIIEGIGLLRFCKENNLNQGHLASVLRGEKFHYKGWTNSEETHKLYKEAFENRCITYRKARGTWLVHQYTPKNKTTTFKTKEEAIAFRNKVAEEGYEFMTTCAGWKEKLSKYSL